MVLTRLGSPNKDFIKFLSDNDDIIQDGLGDIKSGKDLQMHQLMSVHKSIKNILEVDPPAPFASRIPLHSLIFKQEDDKQQHAFKEITIKNPYYLFQYLVSKLTSDLPSDLFIALLFVSGRRSCSLYSGKFLRGPTEYSYTYIEKFKKKTLKSKEKIYPLLCSFSEFQTALTKFRKSHHALTLSKTEKKHARMINAKYSKKHVQFLSNDSNLSYLRPHKLRVLYSAFCTRIFKFDRPVPAVIKYILDHSSMNTSLHYNQWVVDWDEANDLELSNRHPIFSMRLPFSLS